MTTRNTITLEVALDGLARLGVQFELIGPPRAVTKVCSLLHKEPRGLYYYNGEDPDVIGTLEESVAICSTTVAHETATSSCIAVKGDPQIIFYRLCGLLFTKQHEAGIHSTAIIHPDATIAADAQIGPYAIIGRATIGAGSTIGSHTVIMDDTIIGQRVEIGTHCCLGARGSVWVWGDKGERIVLPQLGGVVIGDDVFLSADVSIVRGLLNESTTVGRGCMIAPGSKLGHSAVLDEEVHLANNVSIAGSAWIGARSFLGSGCSVRPHAKIAYGTIVGSGAVVTRDITEPNTTVAGVPAQRMVDKAQSSGVPRRRTMGDS